MQPAPAAAMVSLPLANPHMTSSARHLMATLAKLQSDPSLAVPPPQPGYGSTTIVPDISAVVAAPVGAAAVTASDIAAAAAIGAKPVAAWSTYMPCSPGLAHTSGPPPHPLQVMLNGLSAQLMGLQSHMRGLHAAALVLYIATPAPRETHS